MQFLVAFGLATISIALIIAPVHVRPARGGRPGPRLQRLCEVGRTALALTIATVVVLIFGVVTGAATGVVAGAVILLIFVLVWVSSRCG